MFANEEAPELQSKAVSGQLRFGHPEPVGDAALHSRTQKATRWSDVEPGDEARNSLLAPRPNGLKPVSYTHLTLPTICSV
eukprot:810572-Alexandrium_andersonii.AAC.1